MAPARCRWCGNLIHRQTTDPGAAWVHAERATRRCPDGQHDAEPRDTP